MRFLYDNENALVSTGPKLHSVHCLRPLCLPIFAVWTFSFLNKFQAKFISFLLKIYVSCYILIKIKSELSLRAL